MRIKNVDRIIAAVTGTVWAILPEKLDAICAFLEHRLEHGAFTPEEVRAAIGETTEPAEPQTFEVEAASPGGNSRGTSVVVMPLQGVIARRMNMMMDVSGGTSTEEFGRAFTAAANDPKVRAIVLDVDSPGGSVDGVQELADMIYAARENGTEVIASVNGIAASAAYWIASAASRIVASPSARVGSIGTILVHTEYTEADAQAGVKRTVIRAGANKAVGNPHEKLTREAEDVLQDEVNEYNAMFVNGVARNRGIDADHVMAEYGQGKVFVAARAAEIGMIDGVSTMDELLASLGVRTGGARVRAEEPALRIAAEEPTVGTANTTSINIVADNSSWNRAVSDALPAIRTANTEHPIAAEQADNLTGESGGDTPAPQGADNTEVVMAEANAPQATGAPVTVTDHGAERARAKEIAEMCAAHGIGGESVADYIAGGESVEAVGMKILQTVNQNLRAMSAPVVDMNARESQEYSLRRAILAQAGGPEAGFEMEVSAEIARHLPEGYTPKADSSFFVPLLPGATRLTGGTATRGPELRFDEPGEFIEMLRNQMLVVQAGARTLSGLTGSALKLPKQNGAGTTSWVSENPGSDVAESALTLTQVALDPQTLQSTSSFTRQLLAQANAGRDVEQLVREDMFAGGGLAIDAAAINGLGSSNQPRGILNTSGIGDVAGGTNGLAPTYDHMVDLETAVRSANASRLGSLAYMTTPGVRGKLKKTQKFSGTNGESVWNGEQVNGYNAFDTNQVPSTLTKGTSTDCHAVIFGAWNQLIIGYWTAMEVLVDPYSLKKRGVIEVTSFQMVGLAIRYAEAFAAMKDARTV